MGTRTTEPARPAGGAWRAVVAEAVKDDVVADDGVSGFPFQGVECLFERVVGEGVDLAAVVANEVVVMCAVGVQGLETGGA